MKTRYRILGIVSPIAALIILSAAFVTSLCSAGSDGYYLVLSSGDSDLNNGHPYMIASDVVKASCGYEFMLYVKTDGTLWAFGDNSYGQLGTGDTEDIDIDDDESPVQVATGVADVVCGMRHAMYLTTDGDVYTMGFNGSGQLGIGSEDTDAHSTPTKIATGVSKICASNYNSFYIDDDDNLYGFGYNYYSDLGIGSRTNASTATLVMSGVSECFSCGNTNYCIDDDGILYGWGDSGTSVVESDDPELDGTTIGGMLGSLAGLTYYDDSEEGEGGGDGYLAYTPVLLCLNAEWAVALSSNTVAITQDGKLYVNGVNFGGFLGTGDIDDLTGSSYHPNLSQVASDVIQFQVNDVNYDGGYTYLKDDGSVWAVGNILVNYEMLAEDAYSPVQILSDAGDISAIYDYNESNDYLYITVDGTLWGFGRNTSGELNSGEGDYVYVDSPAKVATDVVDVIIPPVSISGGFYYLTDTQPVDYTYISKSSMWGWMYTEYAPWYYLYGTGNWIYYYSGSYDGTGYWIFYYTNDFSDYGWGYCYGSGGFWCYQNGTDEWTWVWYGEGFP